MWTVGFFQFMLRIGSHQIKKRKIESYFKDNLGVNGILFLQEIHSTSNTATL